MNLQPTGGQQATASPNNHTFHEAVNTLAYGKWVARGRSEGSPLQDWVEAEGEMHIGMPLAPEQMTGLFEEIFQNSPAGFLVFRADDRHEWTTLRLITANPAASRLLGIRLEEQFGKTIVEAFPNAVEADVLPMLDVLSTDRGIDIGDRLYGDDRIAERWCSRHAFPLGNDCIGLLFEDINERVLSHRRVTVEHAVTRVLAESTEILAAAPHLLQAICECLGWDVGALWTIDQTAQVLRCVDMWHLPTVLVPEFERVSRERTFVCGIGMPGRVWANRTPAWIPDVTRDDNFPRAAVAAREGLGAACGFALHNGGDVLGIMEFFSREIQPLDKQLLDMMDSIGSQISQFVEWRRAERIVHDRDYEFVLARAIQQGLLPAVMPELPGLAIAGAAQPTQETGGDYWDVFRVPDGRLAIVVGDASGHGIGAALIIAETRACLRALALTHSDPGRLVTLLNQLLSDGLPTDHFVTLLLVVIDPCTGALEYVNAGHCPGFVMDRHGEVRSANSTGFPLGILPGTEYSSAAAAALQVDDLLFFFTDGIVDARSEANLSYGIARALSVIRAHRDEAPAETIQALFRDLADFGGAITPFDDCTAVIIKFT